MAGTISEDLATPSRLRTAIAPFFHVRCNDTRTSAEERDHPVGCPSATGVYAALGYGTRRDAGRHRGAAESRTMWSDFAWRDRARASRLPANVCTAPPQLTTSAIRGHSGAPCATSVALTDSERVTRAVFAAAYGELSESRCTFPVDLHASFQFGWEFRCGPVSLTVVAALS